MSFVLNDKYISAFDVMMLLRKHYSRHWIRHCDDRITLYYSVHNTSYSNVIANPFQTIYNIL